MSSDDIARRFMVIVVIGAAIAAFLFLLLK